MTVRFKLMLAMRWVWTAIFVSLLALGVSKLAHAQYGPPAQLPADFNAAGRLTLTTGVPVLTSTVAGATSVIYTNYKGNQMPAWNGNTWYYVPFPELANVLANSSVGAAGPAAAANNSVYDLYVWWAPPGPFNPSGSPTPFLTRSPAWTSNTSRGSGAGTAQQVLVQGIITNAVAITNGPPAQTGVYVGTIATNGTATVDWILGASASGGTAARLAIWNEYNRIPYQTSVVDNGIAYTYTSSTIRQARGSAGNQISFLIGEVEDMQNFTYCEGTTTIGASAATVIAGFGLNSTTTFQGQKLIDEDVAAVTLSDGRCAGAQLSVTIGLSVISANEASDNVNANSFDVNSTNTLSGTIMN